MTTWHTASYQKMQASYRTMEDFLIALRAGDLQKDFCLEDRAFQELVTHINANPVLAKEIMDSGILMLLASQTKEEVDGVLALAEVCREDRSATEPTPAGR